MNPKYRALYLLVGFAGFFFLIYDTIVTLPEINPVRALLVALPDMVIFYLAYRTYPVEEQASVKTSKIKSY
jgi:hypothetical protein